MRRWIAAAVFLLPLAAPGAAQAPARVPDDQESFSIAVDVNLIVLQASVRDRQRRDVVNLKQENFKLFEDGAPQTIRMFRREDAPVTVGLVVDHSGSMSSRLGQVVLAASQFAESSNPMDEMFVVNFNEKVFYGLPRPHQFTDKPQELRDAIANAPVAGETALYDAIAAGLEHLQTGRWDKKVLVVISDGGDNASTHTLANVVEMAERSNAVIYTIGIFDPDNTEANPGVLRRLAEMTGGEWFFPKKLTELSGISGHIAQDVRNQYMIGYVSSNTKGNGSVRSIRLVAEAPGSGKLQVRTRTNYIAQSGKQN